MFIIKKIKEEDGVKFFDYRLHYFFLISFLLAIVFFGTIFFIYSSNDGSFPDYTKYISYLIPVAIIVVIGLDTRKILPSYFKTIFGLARFNVKRKKGLTFRVKVLPVKKDKI